MTPNERLAHLATVLRTKELNNLDFNLHVWIETPDRYKGEVSKKEAATRALEGENFCGTSACAVGLACLLPEFQAEGLMFYSYPVYRTERGYFENWEAVRKFFDLDEEDTERLFMASYYDTLHPTREQVADRIEELLARKELRV